MGNWKNIKHRCPKCNSANITPTGKRVLDKSNDICEYLCEDCNHHWGPVVYATKV